MHYYATLDAALRRHDGEQSLERALKREYLLDLGALRDQRLHHEDSLYRIQRQDGDANMQGGWTGRGRGRGAIAASCKLRGD